MPTAFIFAAGLGTRLRPYTNDRPKALVEIAGKTLLQIQIERLKKFGYDRIIVNIHHFPEMMKSFLTENSFGVEIIVSDESDLLLDTGGGLKKIEPLIIGYGPVLVCNVDVLTDLDLHLLRKNHIHSGAIATLAVRDRETARKLLFDDTFRMKGWTNISTGEMKVPGNDSPALKPFAFSGIQIINDSFPTMLQREGVFSIIDGYLDLCSSHEIMGYQHQNGIWLDVGKPETLRKAEDILNDIS